MPIHALHIGNNYRGTADELPSCELDAERLAKAFGPYCASQVVLTGRDATRNGILYAGRTIKSKLKRGDLWVITNSSHGTWENKTAGGLAAGGRRRRVEAVVCDGFELIYDFEMDELVDDERAAGSVVFAFSDSCFSGGLERALHTRRKKTIPLHRAKPHAANPPQKDRPLPGVVFISGCRTKEESFDTGDGGAATNALLQAFREQGAGSSFARLYGRIAGNKGSLLPSDEWPQHPQLEGAAEDVARTFQSFVRKK
jgi:hypothetical protein